MAKSAQGFPVSEGSGASLSLFQLANARLRETVIIGDSDTSGEALHVELPAHDDADRGSPLKIGGKASTSAPTAVGEQDRTDAWYAPNGQMRVVATAEPAIVYDVGRQVVLSIGGAGLALNNTSAIIIPAGASLLTKLLALYVSSTTFTTAGSLGLVGGATQFWFARVTAANQNFNVPPGRTVQYVSGTSAALSLKFTGNGAFDWTAVYYRSP